MGVRLRPLVAAPVAVLVVASACSSGSPSRGGTDGATDATSASTATTPAVAPATYRPAPCPDAVGDLAEGVEASCGTLEVPERHDDPDGPTVTLPVAVLTAPGRPRAPDPVVYLDGGPGGDALGSAGMLSELELVDERDVVVVGQRGTPLAVPSFDCPEVEQATVEAYDQALGPDTEARRRAALAACSARVAQGGPAFDAYDSATAADDVEAARRALGYERWNLFGISYGTRLALEVVRRHPDAVRSVVLDSAYPAEVDAYTTLVPGAQRAFGHLVESCEADPACAAAYPQLEARVAALYDSLEASPVDVTVEHPTTGQPVTMRWDGTRVALAAFAGMYVPEIIGAIPSLLAGMERGEFDLVSVAYLQATEALAAGQAEGLYLSVECRERAPFSDPGEVAAVAAAAPPWLVDAATFETQLSDCDAWQVPPAPPEVREVVRTDVPVLVLAGSFDPITPPAWGRQVADAQTTAWFFELPGQSHGVTGDPCAGEVMTAFLAAPATDPSQPCLAGLAGPSWVLP